MLVQAECNEACFNCRGAAEYVPNWGQCSCKPSAMKLVSIAEAQPSMFPNWGQCSCKPSAMKLVSIAEAQPSMFPNWEQRYKKISIVVYPTETFLC